MNNNFQTADLDQLKSIARTIRREVVSVCVKNGAGHIAPSLSCVDILVALYYNIMHLTGAPTSLTRDRFIISKAHGAYALYAILADIGFIKKKDWKNFYNGSHLMGCVERNLECGLEAGCGSLGHGLPMAVGAAMGFKMQNLPNRVFCLLGDGELQEGSNWEALQTAAKFKLDNLTMIIDGNNLQAMDFLVNILSYKTPEHEIVGKFQAFGAETVTCDGHDMKQLVDNLSHFQDLDSKPHALYARTVKGYGLKAIENIPKFHFRIPNKEELNGGWSDE
jgi:transketolase